MGLWFLDVRIPETAHTSYACLRLCAVVLTDTTCRSQCSLILRQIALSGEKKGTSNGTRIAHVYANQLENVNIYGDGLTLVLSGDSWKTVYGTGAAYIGVQISGGSGRFLFEETNTFFDDVVGDGVRFKLLDSNGEDISSSWVASTYISNHAGTSVSEHMLWFAIVPEPSTATLSLMALTMLVTRRRRK